MNLGELAAAIGAELPPSLRSKQIDRITTSSDEVCPGALFVAIPGTKADGHQFLADVFRRGATAAVVSKLASDIPGVQLQVSDSRRALSQLAASWYGHPSRELKTVGITGTNGKTTTNWLLFHLLNSLGVPTLRVGTLGIAFPGRVIQDESLTTPDALTLHATLAAGLREGIRGVVMEVSSHALDQLRVEDVAFDVGVFTNLTRDHLDYHGTEQHYFSAKRRLFQLVGALHKCRVAVVNADDPHGAVLRSELKDLGLRDLSFGRNAGAIRLRRFQQEPPRSRLQLFFEGQAYEIHSHFIGEHNAENLAAAFGAAVGLGFSPAEVAERLGGCPQVPGRLQLVGGEQRSVYVDYAHTPDALERVLLALRSVARGKLWVVFGCGGDRDRGKRPIMGAIAQRLADHVVVTSDNPRTEDPQGIIQEILGGATAPTFVEPDRKRAIGRVLEEAGDADIVLIAGKGHENYQIIGSVKHPFSDVEEVERVLHRS